MAGIADMPRVVQLLGAQIDDQSALVHEPDSLHAAQCGKRLNAGAKLVDDHDYRSGQSRARKVRMIANEL